MQDMIKKIVDMDEKAQEITEEAKRSKALSAQEIAETKERIRENYLADVYKRQVLGRGGSAHNRVLVQLSHLADDRARPQGVAKPPSRHSVSLRKAADHHGALLHVLNFRERDMRLAAVSQFAVNLVGKDE